MIGTSGKPETDTETRILEAALDVFSRKGLHGATTKEIADAAGVQKSTVHYYFRHKEDLYATVFERAYAEMLLSFESELTDEMGFAEVLRAFIEHHVRGCGTDPRSVHLWMHENLIGAPVSGEVLQRYQSMPGSPYRRFVDSLRQAIAAGEVREVSPAHTFVSVMGACLFFHVARPSLMASLPSLMEDGAKIPDAEHFLEQRVDALYELLWRGLAA